MKTNKAKDTHNAIVKAAELLFLEKSVSKVTINDIVNKAGVAKGTFYLYFESKDDLVWHFIEHQIGYADKWFIQLSRYGYRDEDIDNMIDFIVAFTKKHMKILKMMHNVGFYSFLGLDNVKKRYTDKWVLPLELWLEKGKMQGELVIDDAKFLAYFLVITIHEMIDKIICDEAPFSMDDFGQQCKTLVKKMVK